MKSDLHWVKTHCSRMDHGGCALLVGVKDNRIMKIKGDPKGFLNKGYVCPKGLAAADRLYHPDRLRYPLKRVGNRGEGKWKRITWREALETICENLLKIKDRYGARSVAFCQGMPKGMEHYVLIRLANVFGSPNVVGTQDVCHAPREVTGVHTCGFYPVADFSHHTELALLWGSNITSTNEEGEICSLLLSRIKKGTELIVVDPRRTDLADRARYWLQLRPGTDHALALSFLHVIIEEGLFDQEFVKTWVHGFDEFAEHVKEYTPEKVSKWTWVPASLIQDAAICYAKACPAAIQWGNAIEQNIYTFDISRTLTCLMAVCGNLDVPGGNIQANEPDYLRLGNFVLADQLPDKREEMIHVYHHAIPRMMTVPPALFRRAVLDGFPYPVRGAYMQVTNPLLAYAESRMTLEALNRLEFCAVADIFMTPTASFADIVLPAATAFEFDDIGHAGLGHGYILARPKIVDPPEECWPDIKILNELGKGLTSGEFWHEDYHGFLDELLRPTGLNYTQFAEKGYLKGPDRFKKYETKRFRTPTGKVELCLSRARDLGVQPMPLFTGFPDDEDPGYPLVLTSKKSGFYLHSSYRWIERLRRHRPFPRTDIHPETAARYGIQEGDRVIIKTKNGEIRQVAHLSGRIHPGVICSDYGWWFPEAGPKSQYDWESSNYNMLTSAKKIGKEFGTPNLKGIGCTIRRVE